MFDEFNEFFNKIKYSYSFNFLALFGLVIFVLICPIVNEFLGEFPTYMAGEVFFLATLMILRLAKLTLLYSAVALLIYIFERKSGLKFKNKKFFDNKFVNALQILGILSQFFPIYFIPLLLFVAPVLTLFF